LRPGEVVVRGAAAPLESVGEILRHIITEHNGDLLITSSQLSFVSAEWYFQQSNFSSRRCTPQRESLWGPTNTADNRNNFQSKHSSKNLDDAAGVNVSDIKVVGKYAYVSGQSGGPSEVLIFDISNSASPYLLSSLPAGHSPQGLDVEGNFWYQTIYDNDITYGVPALDIYNISNPSTFYQVGTADGYISLPATSHPIFLEAKGRYVYSISNNLGGMLSVIDTGQ
jgi:hypothetical protein